MNQQVAPYTGFAGIPFTILSDSGRITDWHRELGVNDAKVSDTVRNFMLDTVVAAGALLPAATPC